jgi:hypothetical protein
MEIPYLDWRIVAPVPVSYSFLPFFGISSRRKFCNRAVRDNCHSINDIYITSDIYEP